MIDRAALVLKWKKRGVQWINGVVGEGTGSAVTVDEANEDRPVYLVGEDAAEDLDAWLRENYETIFEMELRGWYTEEGLWPKDRTYELFREWFDVECHSVIYDMGGGPIYDDDDVE